MLREHRLSIWPTLPPRAFYRRPFTSLPFPLEESQHRVFSRARHGLFQGVRALGIRPGEVVLVPAYHHGSEIEALERAGLTCRFYDIGADLQPDPESLEASLGPDVRAFYLIHYFGMPQRADRWRAWCDRHGIILIEDAAMAFLAREQGLPVGSLGELAIYCLYKTFALPDGGAMICTASVPYPRGHRPLGTAQGLMRMGSWFAQRSRAFATLHEMIAGDRTPPWGRDFDLDDPATPATSITTALVPRIIDASAAARRRSNYEILRGELEDRLQPLVATVPDGASPIAFLFESDPDDRANLQRALAERGVMLANFWLVPHPSLPDGFGSARNLRRRVVGLPVHQELRDADLEQIVAAVRSAGRQMP